MSAAPTSWPALVGEPAAAAVAAITAAVPASTEVIEVDHDAMVTADYRVDRVRVFVKDGKVASVPSVG